MLSWLTLETLTLLAQGVLLTVILTTVSSLTSFALGIFVGTLRLSPKRYLHWPATTFIEIHRNIPALVLPAVLEHVALVHIDAGPSRLFRYRQLPYN